MRRTIGIIAEDLTVFNTPGIVDGIGVCCGARNFHYILGNLRLNKLFGHKPGLDSQKTALGQEMLDEMLSKQVDGILHVGCHSHQIPYLNRMENIPFAYAYSYCENHEIPFVIYDDRKAALAVGRYLLEKGITAVFAHNDLIALGVIDYCNRNGLVIGKDLDLIGFDDREIATVCHPPLTTVSLPLFDIGYRSADILLDQIESKKSPEEKKILLECRFIERESTGA